MMSLETCESHGRWCQSIKVACVRKSQLFVEEFSFRDCGS